MRSMTACYPHGKRAALTLSYDDGQLHDRTLVSILNRYGIKATFHLNSGMLDTSGYLDGSEIAALYAGHEVACHSVSHPYLTQIPQTALATELLEDRRALEKAAGYPVVGGFPIRLVPFPPQ